MRKSNHSLCMVEKYGAFSVLVWSKKCTLLLVNVFERPTEDSNVYGDLGRYHLFVNSCIRAVKYWFKLTYERKQAAKKQAYHMQINMELNGKCIWASKLRDLLCKFGFGFV